MKRVFGLRMLAAMKMRSCSDFVIPITLTGLQALSVRDADHGLDRIVVFLDRAHDVLGAEAVGEDRLDGKVLAGRHLLQRRGIDHDVGVAQHRCDDVA